MISGFTDLDRKTNGFQSTDLILIAARLSMGKTVFSLNLVANAAIKGKASVAVFSLKMSNEQLVDRMIAANAQVELSNIRNGSLKDFYFRTHIDAQFCIEVRKRLIEQKQIRLGNNRARDRNALLLAA